MNQLFAGNQSSSVRAIAAMSILLTTWIWTGDYLSTARPTEGLLLTARRGIDQIGPAATLALAVAAALLAAQVLVRVTDLVTPSLVDLSLGNEWKTRADALRNWSGGIDRNYGTVAEKLDGHLAEIELRVALVTWSVPVAASVLMRALAATPVVVLLLVVSLFEFKMTTRQSLRDVKTEIPTQMVEHLLTTFNSRISAEGIDRGDLQRLGVWLIESDDKQGFGEFDGAIRRLTTNAGDADVKTCLVRLAELRRRRDKASQGQ